MTGICEEKCNDKEEVLYKLKNILRKLPVPIWEKNGKGICEGFVEELAS